MIEIIAHRDKNDNDQPIKEHLLETAEMSSRFSEAFGLKEMGYLTGLMHDIGKYSLEFQKYIRKEGDSTVHSTAGAVECFKYRLIMPTFCIAGHHGGLNDLQSLVERMKSNIPEYEWYKEEIDTKIFNNVCEKGSSDYFYNMFMIRMLFSALVDADYIDTERFMSKGKIDRESYDSLEVIHDKLNLVLQNFSDPKSELNCVRYSILQECIRAASSDHNLFSLTVPTGGGKTWSSMAFAIKHAIKYHKQRIIYVIPYTSIIEQTVDIFRGAFGDNNVLEHHSNADMSKIKDEKNEDFLQLAAENWDIPIVVTTNVQFFESLMAYKNSKCRKLHNIANSVIVFDEAQMLPMQYLKPCAKIVSELIEHCNCTALLCTATQPNLQRFFEKEKIHEIIGSPQELFVKLQRTRIQFEGKLELVELARVLERQKQVLCIVNTKKVGVELFEMIQSYNGFYLSTYMTPKHRREVLEQVKDRLKNGLPCTVVSTTVLEAGVDIDFPIVYREMSGIDSILQAAGRCNREGKRDIDESIVHVFELEKIPEYIQRNRQALVETTKLFKNINDPEAIATYFDFLYKQEESTVDSFDLYGIVKMHNSVFDFRKIANSFHLIEDMNMKSVIVKRSSAENEIQELIDQLLYGDKSRELMRKLAPYIVNIYEYEADNLLNCGAIQPISDDLYFLDDTMEIYYSEKTGINTNPESGNAIFY